MAQIEYRVAHAWMLVVIGRRVDVRLAPGPGDRGVVPARADLAVRNVLRQREIHPRIRNLDAADPLVGREVGPAGRVGYLHAVDDERVVVKPRNRRWRRDGPDAVLVP